jgi:arylsulfatase A-like enzyme
VGSDRTARTAWLLLLLLCPLFGCGSGDHDVSGPRRIILISMDTVRADRVSGYGPSEATPALAEIAEDGVLFSRSYSASSYTIPSHMSIFTGLDPAEHGVHELFAQLNPAVPTMASLLREAGYRTQGFHEGVFVSARFGFDRGFDDYSLLNTSLAGPRSLQRVKSWMRDAGDDPYFLFLHTYRAHYPYGGYNRYREEHPERGLPSRQELVDRVIRAEAGADDPDLHYLTTLYVQLAEGKRDGASLGAGDRIPDERFLEHEMFETDLDAIRESYEARIRAVDDAIADLRDTLIERDQWEDTLLIVTSDHGEAFMEHGLYRHAFVPFDEALRVPLIISYPRFFTEQSTGVVDGLVSGLDLLPTVLGLTGIRPPAGLRGADLRNVMLGRQTLPEDRTIFSGVLRAATREQVPLRRVVLQGTSKYIDGHELFFDPLGFLFDLGRDPGERDNLRTSDPNRFEELRLAARQYEQQLTFIQPVDQRTGEPYQPAGDGADPVDLLDPDELERLQALGY